MFKTNNCFFVLFFFIPKYLHANYASHAHKLCICKALNLLLGLSGP